jgi:CheY-like chemotaxis protein
MAPPTAHLFKAPPDAPPLPILILEDERFDRHRLARMCSALDFQCKVSNATSLQSFSAILESDIFGLILLDYRLPDGTGFDALDMLRLSARNLNTPTLMVSGSDDHSLAEQAHGAGCTSYLHKDRLTSEIFGLAVQNALASAADPCLVDKTQFAQDEIAALVAQLTRRNARDVKPMVSRMMRQLRGIRANAHAEENIALQTVEQNCMSLWALLVEMERQDGTALLQELQKDRPPIPDAPDIAKSRRPPSPFSRLRH